jgi:RNA-splicing ligase RtcB
LSCVQPRLVSNPLGVQAAARKDERMQQISKRLMSWASILEPNTREQAERASTMPFIHPHIALMPDAHLGKGATVGSVIPTLGAIMPAAVGVDIGCGMHAVRTQFTAADMHRGDLASLRVAIENAIPLSAGKYNTAVYDDETAERIAELEARDGAESADAIAPNWRLQLGSLGSGNHFIEVSLDEADHVWLFLHSGSRGVGNKLAMRHIKIAQEQCGKRWISLPDPDLAYLVEGDREFWEYIRDLRWAQHFALLNRQEMMHRVMACLDRWADEPTAGREVVQCHHNYTEPYCLRCNGIPGSGSRSRERRPGETASTTPGSPGDYRTAPRSYDELVRAAREVAEGLAPSQVGAQVRSLLSSLADDQERELARSRQAGGSGHPSSSASGPRAPDTLSSARTILSTSSALPPSAARTLRRTWDTRLAQSAGPGDPSTRPAREGRESSPSAPDSVGDVLARNGGAGPSSGQGLPGSGSPAQSSGRSHTHTDHLSPQLHDTWSLRCGHKDARVWLSRKGAIDASEGTPGLIPGSMGTRSYVVRGKGNRLSLNSSPHGAGREYSRSAARKHFTRAELDTAMEGIEWRQTDAFLDEIPGAYKDIDVVMRDAADLVEVRHTLRQIVNVKGD